MVLAHQTKSEKDNLESRRLKPAPNAPNDSRETRISHLTGTGEAYRIDMSDILLRNIRSGHHNIRVVSPGECLKCINDAGLTSSYLKFDRNFANTGIDESILSGFARALKCRYLFIGQAVIYEYTSDSSLTVIWTFGKKSTLRSVNITGQIGIPKMAAGSGSDTVSGTTK